METEEERIVHKIPSFQPSHSGQYECIVTRPDGALQRHKASLLIQTQGLCCSRKLLDDSDGYEFDVEPYLETGDDIFHTIYSRQLIFR